MTRFFGESPQIMPIDNNNVGLYITATLGGVRWRVVVSSVEATACLGVL